jgi:hypothetical protein
LRRGYEIGKMALKNFAGPKVRIHDNQNYIISLQKIRCDSQNPERITKLPHYVT